jgi:SET domain
MKKISSQHLPHRNLYTRIMVSTNGVGVFAIRDIPEGTRLFVGDAGGTVAIPVPEVEAIADEEVRRMYTDFCPVVNDCFVAPRDFNQITMGWYLNHSAEPNVAASNDLQFIASRFIPKGEELVSDYTTYSDHADKFVGRWKVPGAKS